MSKIAAPEISPKPFGTFAPSWVWRLAMGRSDFGQKARPGSKAWINRRRRWVRAHRPIFDVTYHNIKLRLYPGENSCDRKIVVFGDHAVHGEFDAARPWLETATVLVDIGANIGLYALCARAMMPASARILAFEPDPRTVQKLRQNLAFNIADNVSVINCAVGPTEDHLRLYRSDRNAGRNSLVADSSDDTRDDGQTVQVRPLATVLAEQGVDHIDVLKIDVEGFEADALAPFLETAPPELWPAFIMIETAGREKWSRDLLEMLFQRGYETTFETPRDMHLARRSPVSGTDTQASGER